jgi:hypothetical protein
MPRRYAPRFVNEGILTMRQACAESFKAADDARSAETFARFDPNGVFGACCRHDSALHLIDLERCGEK